MILHHQKFLLHDQKPIGINPFSNYFLQQTAMAPQKFLSEISRSNPNPYNNIKKKYVLYLSSILQYPETYKSGTDFPFLQDRSVMEWIRSTRNEPLRHHVQLLLRFLIMRNRGEISKKSRVEFSSYSLFICSMIMNISATGEIDLC